MKSILPITIVILIFLSLPSITSSQTLCQRQVNGYTCGGEWEFGDTARKYCVSTTGTLPADSPCRSLYNYPSSQLTVCSTTSNSIDMSAFTTTLFSVTLPSNLISLRSGCKSTPLTGYNTTCCDIRTTGQFCITPQCKCPRPCTGSVTQSVRTGVDIDTSMFLCYQDCIDCNYGAGLTTTHCAYLRANSLTYGGYYFGGPSDVCCTKITTTVGTSQSPTRSPQSRSPQTVSSQSPTRSPITGASQSRTPSNTPTRTPFTGASQSNTPSRTRTPATVASQTASRSAIGGSQSRSRVASNSASVSPVGRGPLWPVNCPGSPVTSGQVVVCASNHVLINDNLAENGNKVEIKENMMLVINGWVEMRNTELSFEEGGRMVINSERVVLQGGINFKLNENKLNSVLNPSDEPSSNNKRRSDRKDVVKREDRTIKLILEKELIIWNGNGSNSDIDLKPNVNLVNLEDECIEVDSTPQVNNNSYTMVIRVWDICGGNGGGDGDGEKLGAGIGIGVLIMFILGAVAVATVAVVMAIVIMKRKGVRMDIQKAGSGGNNQWDTTKNEIYTTGESGL